jgi:hypothetical protein
MPADAAARLEEALTAAVRASVPLDARERAHFCGRYLLALSSGSAPPEAAAASDSARGTTAAAPDSTQQREVAAIVAGGAPLEGELRSLSSQLTHAVNLSRSQPDWPIGAVGRALLETTRGEVEAAGRREDGVVGGVVGGGGGGVVGGVGRLRRRPAWSSEEDGHGVLRL